VNYDSLGTSPLMAAVAVGAAQNVLCKAAKYSLFDPCKEMAYIPLGTHTVFTSSTMFLYGVNVVG